MAMLPGSVQSAAPGTKGFDVHTPISASAAHRFLERGYRFCVRHVGRLTPRAGDLTHAEARGIVGAGLALMVMQHVRSGSGWNPDGALGTTYGVNAAAFACQAGIPPGVNLWLDLKGVSPRTATADVMAYCENWYHRVADVGYLPGIYIGWRPGLSAGHLYQLPFQHYWGAYNVNDDFKPVWGWCLKQSPASGGTIAGVHSCMYDDDVTRTDRAGRNVHWLTSA